MRFWVCNPALGSVRRLKDGEVMEVLGGFRTHTERSEGLLWLDLVIRGISEPMFDLATSSSRFIVAIRSPKVSFAYFL